MSRITKLLLFGAVFLVITVTLVKACPYHDRLKQLKRRYATTLDALEGEAKEEYLTTLRQRAFREMRPYLASGYTNYKQLHPDLFDRFGRRKTITEESTQQTPTRHQHHSSSTRQPPRNPQKQHHSSSSSIRPSSVPVVNGHSYNRRPVVSRRPGGSRVQPQVNRNQFYIGSSVFQPEQHVSCPNTDTYFCPVGNECIYRFGRYKCRPIRQAIPRLGCRPGYKKENISDIQYQCVDIDECEDEDRNTCEHTCINVRGGFRCRCRPGYNVQSNGSCADVDECASRYQYCQHECTNTIGSYQCACPEGYTFNTTTGRCKDINECENEEICAEGERCLNTYGGHECYSPEPCEAGYERSNAASGNFGPCVLETYEQSDARPVSISQNRFALHSNYPAYQTVATMSFSKVPYHYYSFRMTRGREYFRIVYNPLSNIIRISTIRRLLGPFTYQLSIEVSDQTTRTFTRSRLDISFVVSRYSF